MRVRPFAFAASLIGLVSVPATAQESALKTTHVAGNVYMIEGRGGTIGVSVGKDGILIVDDQFAVLAGAIRAALKDLDKGELKFVLNTHYHGDHTGGNRIFGKEATIIAHRNVRQRLSTPQQIRGKTQPPMDEVGWPIVTFDDAVSVHFNGEEILMMHVPEGHTDGDAMVMFTESKVLHMGDQLFSGWFPYVDLDHGGTVQGYLANLEKVLATVDADVKIIPGHGPLSTLDDVRKARDMIAETTDLITRRMEAGKSLEEIQEEGLPEKFASFDWQFISTARWIEQVYHGLSR